MSSTDLTTQDAIVQAAIAQQQAEFADTPLTVPMLKIGQPLTREVNDDLAEAGDFINTLTGSSYGNKVGFIIAYYNQGRFGSKKGDNRAYAVNYLNGPIPEHWKDLVGPENVGVPFSEYSEAEERYRERVNNGEIEWGSGPIVSTTHNYTGLVVVPGFDDEEDELHPVRLSLKRTDVKTAKKITTILQTFLRGKPPWEKVFDLTTEKNSFRQGVAHNLKAGLGRVTTIEERERAQELFLAVASGRVEDNASAQVEKPEAPASNGGIAL